MLVSDKQWRLSSQVHVFWTRKKIIVTGKCLYAICYRENKTTLTVRNIVKRRDMQVNERKSD